MDGIDRGDGAKCAVALRHFSGNRFLALVVFLGFTAREIRSESMNKEVDRDATADNAVWLAPNTPYLSLRYLRRSGVLGRYAEAASDPDWCYRRRLHLSRSSMTTDPGAIRLGLVDTLNVR